MASIHFTDRDRDDKGFIKAPAAPRSLADLLPKPDEIRTDATRRPRRDTYATLAIIAVGAAFVLVYGWQSPQALPTAVPQARVTPIATFQPTSAPTPAPVATGRLLIAFAAPDGVALGAIESTRAIVPTAHYGDGWIQADVAGSGLVWLRAADLPGVALIGPDLAPRPAPAYVPVAAPPAAPAPTQCAEVGVAGKEARSCGTEDLSVLQERAKEMWAAAFGGNIGSGDMHPTLQPWETTP